ncbi:MAG TPA: hypothetical protein VGF16_21015 [Bryobacteraceae bacterium]|jgi:hypothetical protein
MRRDDHHFSDQELLMAADGEDTAEREAEIREHLAACWTCRVRRRELEDAIAGAVGVYRSNLNEQLPSAAGPRAMLKAHLAEQAGNAHRGGPPRLLWRAGAVAAAVLLAAWVVGHWRSAPAGGVMTVSVPNANLTPGAAILANARDVCVATSAKNRTVPVALQRRVFAEYGIGRAEVRDYEVDYLITPALGGTEDIHNLWPQSYTSTVWNAQVKDALEDRLHELVCEGKLDLATAQRDISKDWIAAYKKYFQTDRPLVTP